MKNNRTYLDHNAMSSLAFYVRKARIFENKDSLRVEFEEPVRAVTPGQAAVRYRDQQLVGGGWVI